eukprot:365028-Chlamydomonas_euryale.AAC.51
MNAEIHQLSGAAGAWGNGAEAADSVGAARGGGGGSPLMPERSTPAVSAQLAMCSARARSGSSCVQGQQLSQQATAARKKLIALRRAAHAHLTSSHLTSSHITSSKNLTSSRAASTQLTCNVPGIRQHSFRTPSRSSQWSMIARRWCTRTAAAR